MLTTLDHLVIGVTDVALAVQKYRNLGFTVTHREEFEGASQESAQIVFGDFYIEFQRPQDSQSTCNETSADNPATSDGANRIVFGSDNLDEDVARLTSSGFHMTSPMGGLQVGCDDWPSTRPTAVISNTPFALVETRQTPSAGSASPNRAYLHPNTATILERIYLAVESIDADSDELARLLDIPAPEPEMGTVIMSLMSVFYVGDVGIAVAEPRGPGPTADALTENGPGLFQLLFRAQHLDQAAALMTKNGVPAPTRGTRLSGESALLVEPENACNLFVALAGQP